MVGYLQNIRESNLDACCKDDELIFYFNVSIGRYSSIIEAGLFH